MLLLGKLIPMVNTHNLSLDLKRCEQVSFASVLDEEEEEDLFVRSFWLLYQVSFASMVGLDRSHWLQYQVSFDSIVGLFCFYSRSRLLGLVKLVSRVNHAIKNQKRRDKEAKRELISKKP